MDNLYEIDIIKSYGSRTSRDVFRNTHHYATNHPLTAPEVETTAHNIAEAERNGSTSEVHFLRAHVSQCADNPLNKPKHAFVIVDLEGTGTRQIENATIVDGAIVYDEKVLPKDVCLLINRQAKPGRSGHLFERGCLVKDDVEVTKDRRWALVSTAHWAGLNHMCGMLDAAAVDGHLALKGTHSLIITNSRQITVHMVAGVAMHQATRHKTRTVRAQSEVVKRLIKGAYNAIWQMLGGAAITTALPALLTAIEEYVLPAAAALKALPAAERVALLAEPEILEAAEYIGLLALL